MRIDLAADIHESAWAPLPGHDRVMVGGRTMWIGPFDPPVLVAQPNRWGVIEGEFPPVPCLVEADPLVTGLLDLPEVVVGFVDRSHTPIDPPPATTLGKELMEAARILAKILTQIRGVVVAATPFARTVPVITPLEPSELIAACSVRGVVGIRPLAGMAGAVALTVGPDHGRVVLDRVAEVVAEAVEDGNRVS